MGIKEWAASKATGIKGWTVSKAAGLKERYSNFKAKRAAAKANKEYIKKLRIETAAKEPKKPSLLKKIGWGGTKLAGSLVGSSYYSMTGNSVNLFIIASIIYHLIVIFFNVTEWYSKIILNFVFILVVYFFILEDEEKNSDTYNKFGLILFLEIGLPYLLTWNDNPIANMDFVRLYVLSGYLTLWWFYYALYRARGRTRFAKLLNALVVMFWIPLLLLSLPATTFSKAGTLVGPEQQMAAKEIALKTYEWWKEVFSRAKQGVLGIEDAWKRQMEYATGDYYTGRVEENAKEPIGVFLETLKPSDSEFERNEKVIVWGMLKAKTLDDSIDVNIDCYAGRENARIPKLSVHPPQVKIYDLAEEDVDCDFYGFNLNQGVNRVTMTAYFNFETMAYVKTYFMDEDRLSSMRREGIDPLTQFKIEDKKPAAIFTNGPVRIGMGTRKDPPIGIKAGPYQPTIGVTLDNNLGWQGKIKRIKELVIQVPDSMSIDFDSCSHSFREYSAEDCVNSYMNYHSKQYTECLKTLGFEENDESEKAKSAARNCVEETCRKELDGYNAYQLDVAAAGKSLEDIKEYKTFSCKLNIDSIPKLLGSTPITTKYLRARTRYDYEIEKSTNVNIRLERGGERYTAPKDPTELVQKVYGLYKDYIDKAGNEFGIDKCLITAIIAAESGGNAKAVSNAGAKGLMQLMDATANEMAKSIGIESYNIFDPETNIRLGTRYLLWLKQNTLTQGNEEYVIAGYNSGPGGLKESKDCQGMKNYQCEYNIGYAETREYVPTVQLYKNKCADLKIAEQELVYKAEKNTKDFIEKSGMDVTNISSLATPPVTNYIDIATEREFYISADNIEFTGKSREGGFLFKLNFNSKETETWNKEWQWDRKFPFARFKLVHYPTELTDERTYAFEIESMKDSVVNRIVLASTVAGKEKTEIWKGMAYARYYIDGKKKELSLYDNNGARFCTVHPDDYASIKMCEEATPGMIIKIKRISDNSIDAQFEYDNTFLQKVGSSGETSNTYETPFVGGKWI